MSASASETTRRPDGGWDVHCPTTGAPLGFIKNTGKRQWAAISSKGDVIALAAESRQHAIRMLKKGVSSATG